MAIAFVSGSFAHSETGNSGSDRTLAFAQAVSAGSLLVCAVATFNEAGLGVSDSINGVWTQVGTYITSAGQRLSLWYFPNSAAGTPTVTVSPDGTAYISFAIHEYTGAMTVAPLRSSSTNTGLSTTPSSGSVTTTAGELSFAAYCQVDTALSSATVASPYTIRENYLATSVEGLGTADDVAAPGDEAATFTLSNSVNWLAFGASFKAAPATAKLFRTGNLSGLGSGGPFFQDPLSGA